MVDNRVKQAIRLLISEGNLMAASRIVRCLRHGSDIRLGLGDTDWAIDMAFESVGLPIRGLSHRYHSVYRIRH